MSLFKYNLLWLVFGQLLENLGYFSFQHLVTLFTQLRIFLRPKFCCTLKSWRRIKLVWNGLKVEPPNQRDSKTLIYFFEHFCLKLCLKVVPVELQKHLPEQKVYKDNLSNKKLFCMTGIPSFLIIYFQSFSD